MADKILDKIKDLITQKQNILVIGGAGVGKSYILNKLKELYGDNLHITSTTGVSAINVNGQTIHSWAGIGIANKPVEEVVKKIKSNSLLFRKIITCNMLAIDEISMLEANVFEYLSEVLKGVRAINKPFGGIQVLFFGDFFQLPPVRGYEQERKFCFQTNTWEDMKIQPILLKEAKRQSDKKLIEVLNNIREGNVTDTDIFYSREIDDINTLPLDILRIFGTNSNADAFNQKCFELLKTPKFVYESEDELYSYEKINEQEYKTIIFKNPYSTSNDIPKYDMTLYKQFNEYCKAPINLELKVGCRVMLLQNLDVENGLANGTCGTVCELTHDCVKVKFDNGRCERLEKMSFDYYKNADIKIRRTQFPLRLAYGITIHKSQGMTFDKLVVDFNKIFDYGQAYVALSRTRSLEGLYICNFNPRKIQANKVVVDFYKELEQNATEIIS